MELMGLKARVSGGEMLESIAKVDKVFRDNRARLERKMQDCGPQAQLKIKAQLHQITCHLSILGFYGRHIREDDEYILDYSEASFVGLIPIDGGKLDPNAQEEFYGLKGGNVDDED
jgi:hypothetical protein